MSDINKAIKRVFNTDDGKKLLDYLLKTCKYDETIVTGDTHLTYYNLGQKELVRAILKLVALDEKDAIKRTTQIKNYEVI